jgi:SAM-dependent methyltransferase
MPQRKRERTSIEKKTGILLDVGCGLDKTPTFVGIDKIAGPGVDIVHDLEVFPWPLDDESCLTVVVRHVVEHIKPWLTLQFFDELWRVLKPRGQIAVMTPYAGSSLYWADPTHCNGFTEKTFWYFDPEILGGLWRIYKPKPWKIEKGFPMYKQDGVIECLMSKRGLDEITE